ncbi:methyl-accepting chemotaxis protein [Paenibacillus pasadenensis]|uniref:methyl-accepting chemotaxis protein n=1 Tax=Paenibacillus pasadenensis TaxID=217090 RepID=UPI0020403949|nr:methyl-accepting chemotaxis protein [Paenibacillus pasadenensis]MCM3746222.1 methyl-accepting chemotaxis protein [Paenibacillus pasadenensis]
MKLDIGRLIRIVIYGTIICAALTGYGLNKLHTSFEQVKTATEQEAEYKQLSLELLETSDFLTEQARHYTIDGEKEHYDSYWKEVKETRTRDKVVTRLKELGAPPEELALIQQSKDRSDTLIATEEASMKAVAAGEMDKARLLMFGAEYEKQKDGITALLEQFQSETAELSAASTASADATFNSSLVMAYVFIVLLIIWFGISLFIIRNNIAPIRTMAARMSELASSEGDLTARMETRGIHEVKELARSFNAMMENLRALIVSSKETAAYTADKAQEIGTSGNTVSASAASVSEMIGNVRANAKRNSIASDEAAKASQEAAIGAERIADATQEAAASAAMALQAAEQGAGAVQAASAQIEYIREFADKKLQIMSQLKERTGEITGIADIMQNIASQTNILSLNAAIEAARAGEHGKGFAVVSDEIRKLAEQSRLHASSITGIIQEIESRTDEAYVLIGRDVEEAGKGVEAIAALIQSFRRIEQDAQSVAEQTQEISASTEEMTASIEEISATLESMAKRIEGDYSYSESVDLSASGQRQEINKISGMIDDLAQTSEGLHGLLGRFKTE